MIVSDTGVISDELLLDSLATDENEDKHDETSSLVTLSLLARDLNLSFRRIRTIDNLRGFKELTKLCLDNNDIERIDNLEHLVSLTSLDLSFNRIKNLDGLDKLSSLQDLSVFHNQIEEVGGLEGCQKLEFLSLGENRLASVDDTCKYLAQFQRLKALNLRGNPTCDNADEYLPVVVGHLPALKYIDNHFVATQMLDKNLCDCQSEKVADEGMVQPAGGVGTREGTESVVNGVDNEVESKECDPKDEHHITDR